MIICTRYNMDKSSKSSSKKASNQKIFFIPSHQRVITLFFNFICILGCETSKSAVFSGQVIISLKCCLLRGKQKSSAFWINQSRFESRGQKIWIIQFCVDECDKSFNVSQENFSEYIKSYIKLVMCLDCPQKVLWI